MRILYFWIAGVVAGMLGFASVPSARAADSNVPRFSSIRFGRSRFPTAG